MWRKISLWILKQLGWTLIGGPPRLNQYVLIFAPHTSNWDMPFLLLVRSAFVLRPNFIGKHTIFWPPLGWFFRAIGGEPVNRSKAENVVDQIIDKFNTNPNFKFALSPEGTRSKKDHWKTGFYRVAVGAQVPIQLVYLDTSIKEAGFGPLIYPSGNIEEDFEKFRLFYNGKMGFKPSLASDIKINEKPKG